MSNRKFFALVITMMFVFAVLFASGCGGGSSGGGSDPKSGEVEAIEDTPDIVEDIPEPTPTPAPTPTPTPTPEQKDETASPSVMLEHAAELINIGYQNGDNPLYVTQNLTLPTTIENLDDITVTWTSDNPGVISSAGVVNRQAADSNVTLTAVLTDASQSESVEFDLVVIRKRSRTVEQAKEEIEVKGVNEIRRMNVDNNDLEIIYNESRDRITDIDGAYTDITIINADDALDAIQSIHGILGISDPYEELETDVVTSNAYGAEYTFDQVHNGVRVFGRNITTSANAAGAGDFVASSVVPSATLENANLTFLYTQEQAENIAKEYYEGSFEVRTDTTEKVIFTLGNYENNPIPAYIVSIYGHDDENNYTDENLFVNALNGDVIYNTTNIHTFEVVTRRANNELGDLDTNNPVSFPVITTGTKDYLWDPETKVRLFVHSPDMAYLANHNVGEEWDDPQQISAYTNMIEIMKWWKASFDRDSLDGRGMVVDVVTHERKKIRRIMLSGVLILKKFMFVILQMTNVPLLLVRLHTKVHTQLCNT